MARVRRVRHVTAVVDAIYYDIHPEQLWEPGHDVYDWCFAIGKELKEAGLIFVPKPGGGHSEARWPRTGTGRLAGSLYSFGHRTAPEAYSLNFGAGMPYAMFVHGGTAYQRGGYIYSDMGYANRAFIDANIGTWSEGDLDRNSGLPTGEGRFGILPIHGKMFMTLPPGGGFTRRFHLRVRGQKANPFLVNAWRTVARRHEGLPSDLQYTFGPPVQGI